MASDDIIVKQNGQGEGCFDDEFLLG